MDISFIKNIVEKDGIIFLSYGGFMSQALVSAMTDALEEETNNTTLTMNESHSIYVIFIELAQNMMNHAKEKSVDNKENKSAGLILISVDKTGNYCIHSQNIVSVKDKEALDIKLNDIVTSSKDEIKSKYRELRRSGKDKHRLGGGIGFYEIAKKSHQITYSFEKINDEKYYFHINVTVSIKGNK